MKEITINRKKNTMTKTNKKIINIAPKAEHDSVYVFHNILFNFDVFINARGADDAMEKFDQCEFGKRVNWKIMVELTQQPSDGPNGS